ncbi:MAG: hypothetical protein PGN25_04175 [Methylorubrum populi]
MDVSEIVRRLDAQERLLHLIVGALAPEPTDSEGTGYDDLVETLADLTEAVADVATTLRAMPCSGCVRVAPTSVLSSAGV